MRQSRGCQHLPRSNDQGHAAEANGSSARFRVANDSRRPSAAVRPPKDDATSEPLDANDNDNAGGTALSMAQVETTRRTIHFTACL